MIFSHQPNGLQQNLDQESLLHRMIKQIRRSLDLQEILTTTVNEVRSFLNTDRVKVYKFDPDGSGEVIAESIHQQQLPSLLGLHFPANDIPLESREMFLIARQRTIVDVSKGEIGLSPLKSLETGETLKSQEIYYRQVDPCHIQYLQSMGVNSSLVVPILNYDLIEEPSQPQLWGLLVSHHSQSRTISDQELRLIQQISDQVAIAISQSNLLRESRTQQRREVIINRVSTLLHQLPTMQMQTAVEETIAAFNSIGGRLYIESTQELYTSGQQPQIPIEQHSIWQKWIAQCNPGKIQTISDIDQEPSLQTLAPLFKSSSIRGIMVIPLHYRETFLGAFSIFRSEFDTEILWAGKRQENQYQQLPKLSFELWQETKKGQAPEWKKEDISLATGLSHSFSMAIKQQHTYQELHTLNSQLEQRVQEKTAELAKSLSLTQSLKHVTDQIRGTLDINITLQTIVREVRYLLNSDRVIIYKFLNQLEGNIIVEDINSNWSSILGVKLPSICFPQESSHLYLRGRTRAINNVATAELTPCHQEFLENLQIQANLIVAIKIDTQLWGLLIAHQCAAPRNWQTTEIDLLQQLADQAAVAIQQAQLYEQSCVAEAKATAKATQLEQTLHQLQETQTKLIHSEKMSGLGQLVAGIAHEINNPVNFIYGNLSHANDYTEQILELLQLYQCQYPQPDPKIKAALEAIDFDFVVHQYIVC
ncbi:MAG: GAF domain-containing protein [Cuspidothrix sp.]